MDFRIKALAAAACVAPGVATAAQGVVITEIMYDPAGGNEFEYVELYNPAAIDVDLTGYILSDGPFSRADIPSGSVVPAGGTAVLIRTDGGGGRTLEGFRVAWGTDKNWIPVNDWPGFTNSTAGDTVALYANDAAFQADLDDTNATDPRVRQSGRAVDYVQFDNIVGGAFPKANGFSSIYLTDLSADNSLGANWALSVIGVDGAVAGMQGLAGGVNVDRRGDVGSPGFVVIPEPASAGLVAVGGLAMLRRGRRDR